MWDHENSRYCFAQRVLKGEVDGANPFRFRRGTGDEVNLPRNGIETKEFEELVPYASLRHRFREARLEVIRDERVHGFVPARY